MLKTNLRVEEGKTLQRVSWITLHASVNNGVAFIEGGSIGWGGPKSLLKYAEERSIVYDCAHEEKIVFSGFSQNGCYGNQPHPFEA